MNATTESSYAKRIEAFRSVQRALAEKDVINIINLNEIAGDGVVLDEDFTFQINKIPVKGDYVYLTVNVSDLIEGPGTSNVLKDAPINLDVLSSKALDTLIRVMKKALIILEIRELD